MAICHTAWQIRHVFIESGSCQAIVSLVKVVKNFIREENTKSLEMPRIPNTTEGCKGKYFSIILLCCVGFVLLKSIP